MGKEWNPESWNGHMSVDSDEAGNIETLNSDDFSLPVEVAALLLSKEINSALPKEIVMASLKAVIIQDIADSPQDLPSPPLFGSRPITRLTS